MVLRNQSLNGFNYISQTEIFLWYLFSDAEEINCGVPQGFISDLFLFLTYVNDLPHTLNKAGSYLHADGTCIFYQDKDVEKLEKILKKGIFSLCERFIENKLSIYFGDKTKTTLFSQKKSTPKLSISYRYYSLKHYYSTLNR